MNLCTYIHICTSPTVCRIRSEMNSHLAGSVFESVWYNFPAPLSLLPDYIHTFPNCGVWSGDETITGLVCLNACIACSTQLPKCELAPLPWTSTTSTNYRNCMANIPSFFNIPTLCWYIITEYSTCLCGICTHCNPLYNTGHSLKLTHIFQLKSVLSLNPP